MIRSDTAVIDVHLAAGQWRAGLLDGLRSSIVSRPRSIAPVWFYDDRGSDLFDQITRLDEYYPTRTERALLEAHIDEIVGREIHTLVELGSGTSDKTTILLDALVRTDGFARYVPFDVSEETLRSAATELQDRYRSMAVHGVVGDFHQHLDQLPVRSPAMVAFLGSTIGNLAPAQRASFLASLAAAMAPGDHLLLGVDLVKDPVVLEAAYDDASGVTAAFNRNALSVLNAEVGADFDPDGFTHVARWNPQDEWIEMLLVSEVAQTVHLRSIDLTIDFEQGEELRTEISTKFRPERLDGELDAAGWEVSNRWHAPQDAFALVLATRR